jgi:hypothetical protein
MGAPDSALEVDVPRPCSLDLDQQEEDRSRRSTRASAPIRGSHRLREAHLHNGQAQARALFAPWFAITAVGASLLVAWALFGSERLELIVGWSRWSPSPTGRPAGARSRPAAAGSRSARGRIAASGHRRSGRPRRLWARFPTYAFATQPHDVQVVIGGAMGAMIIAAIAWPRFPAAAFAWIVTMTAPCARLLFGSSSLDPKMGLTIVGAAAVAIFGVARLTRWTYELLQTIARSAPRRNRSGCCSRNMSIAASAGCGRSMPRTGSSTSPRG